MSDLSEEVKQLFPQGKTITLKGKDVVVRPFGFGKFPKVLKLMKDVKLDSVPADVAALTESVQKMNIMTLLADNADTVVELSALAIGQPLAYFDDLPADEGVVLCQAIVEVNADFFIARLQPKLLLAFSGLSQSVGGMLSQGSSQPATA